MMDVTRIVVAMPTYNEIETLEQTVDAVRTAVPGLRVLIVDDASPDGTGELADRIAAADPLIEVRHGAAKRGLGPAYRDAFGLLLADPTVDAIIEMDADGSHDAADLPRLIEAAQHADVVIGSRYVPGGGTAGWSPARERLSRAGNLYARRLLGMPFRDSTAGFRLYRRRVLEAIDLNEVTSDGYGFQIEMVWRAWLGGFTVREVPIVFTERRAGSSKMTRGIVVEALAQVTRWSLRRQRPYKGPKGPESAS